MLIESFCPLGCSFVDYRFTDNRKAVFGAVCALYDQLTAEECQAITDALEERAAILRYEFDLVYEEEAEAAEQDILPRIVAGNLKAWNSPVK